MKIICKTSIVLAFVLSFAGFTSAQTEREKGIDYYLKSDYQNAVESLQKAVEADKTDRETLLFLGMSFARLSKNDKAVDAFKKADKLKKVEPVDSNTNVKFISKPRPSYTDSARQNQTQGTVKLIIEFGADEKIKGIFLFEGLRDGLTEQTISAARKIKFEPAMKNGKPVTAVNIVEYSFTIY